MSIPSQLSRLEAFLAQDPANPSLFVQTIHAAVESGLPARARELMSRAPAAGVESAQLRYLEASILLAERRHAEARAVLRELLQSGLDEVGVWFNLGYASLVDGDPIEAAAALERVIHRDDAPLNSLPLLLRAQHHTGRLDAARVAWNEAPERLRTPEAMAVASLVLLDADDVSAARDLSEGALKAGSQAVEAWVARATVGIADGDEQRAHGLLREAHAAHPHDGRVLSALGTAHMARGDISAAREAFERSLAVMPGHIGAWHALAWCHVVAGDLEEARRSFAAALELDRNFGETHGGLAVIDAMQGRVAEARAGADRARRLGAQGMTYAYVEALLSGDAGSPAKVRDLAWRLLTRQQGTSAIRLRERLKP